MDQKAGLSGAVLITGEETFVSLQAMPCRFVICTIAYL